MLKKLFFSSLAIAGITFYFFSNTAQVEAFSSTPPPAKTGAPGEGNCTDCHTGSTQTANLIAHDISSDVYLAGQTYSITVSTPSNNSVNGFEITAKDASGNLAGEFLASNDAQVLSNGAYAAQKQSTTSNNSWVFQWVAPSANTGSVTFYAAVNSTNANGTTSGDQVYLSSTSVTENITTSIDLKSLNVEAFPNPLQVGQALQIRSNQSGLLNLNILDVTGKLMQSIVNQKIESQNTFMIQHQLSKGIYLLQGQIGSVRFDQQLIVQ